MKYSLLLAFIISVATPTHGAVLLSIDLSDPSAVTFAATSNGSYGNSNLNASIDGFTIEGFFSGSPTVAFVPGNVTGTLTPIQGTRQTYTNTATYVFSELLVTGGPGNDLLFRAGGAAGANSQVFSPSFPAFSGTAVVNLSGVASNLPGAGATGNIYPGSDSGTPALGEWRVVPEPSAFLLFGAAGMMGTLLRRRS